MIIETRNTVKSIVETDISETDWNCLFSIISNERALKHYYCVFVGLNFLLLKHYINVLAHAEWRPFFQTFNIAVKPQTQ